MKAAVRSLFFLIMLLCERNSVDGSKQLKNGGWYFQGPGRIARDEEPQYPDYGSDEQDRWPTMEEIATYSNQGKHPGKRGNYRMHEIDADADEMFERRGDLERVMGHTQPLMSERVAVPSKVDADKEVLRSHLENALYNLLSSTSQLPSKASKDRFASADLLQGHRLPRNVGRGTRETGQDIEDFRSQSK
ncbi:hypothetical protein GDO86_015147 [Hymenochirus boettgeri]|uniref:Uncharacterized protein n=1 Tax=Hymenochirus boettgeri TaxID=247094 RepID=A0A8T2JRQ6_9PIPI|nr:hypothetical protein GDO86_015147 [Hymenochirus boettgeri]